MVPKQSRGVCRDSTETMDAEWVVQVKLLENLLRALSGLRVGYNLEVRVVGLGWLKVRIAASPLLSYRNKVSPVRIRVPLPNGSGCNAWTPSEPCDLADLCHNDKAQLCLARHDPGT